jgi:putative membrane protein
VFESWHSGWHMWGMAGSWVLGLVMVALILWAFARGGFQAWRESPESILKRRYANGDISSEEYNRRLTEVKK